MPRYRLILTRDVTESVTVETDEEGNFTVPEAGWAVDDGNTWDDPYVTDREEIKA